MKVILGILLIIAGVALGLYVGFWLMFIGGIIQFVDAVKADPAEASGVAWGVVKIFLGGAGGLLAGFLTILVGLGLIADGPTDPRQPGPTAKQVEGDFRRAMR